MLRGLLLCRVFSFLVCCFLVSWKCKGALEDCAALREEVRACMFCCGPLMFSSTASTPHSGCNGEKARVNREWSTGNKPSMERLPYGEKPRVAGNSCGATIPKNWRPPAPEMAFPGTLRTVSFYFELDGCSCLILGDVVKVVGGTPVGLLRCSTFLFLEKEKENRAPRLCVCGCVSGLMTLSPRSLGSFLSSFSSLCYTLNSVVVEFLCRGEACSGVVGNSALRRTSHWKMFECFMGAPRAPLNMSVRNTKRRTLSILTRRFERARQISQV